VESYQLLCVRTRVARDERTGFQKIGQLLDEILHKASSTEEQQEADQNESSTFGTQIVG
jgi:hypothetical protein